MSRRKEKDNVAETILDEIMTENFQTGKRHQFKAQKKNALRSRKDMSKKTQ